MDAALILQNKGGGHGEIGFHLAKQLKGKGLDVHILQVVKLVVKLLGKLVGKLVVK
jgi:hypothetical protein